MRAMILGRNAIDGQRKCFQMALAALLMVCFSGRSWAAVPPTITGNGTIENFTTSRSFSDGQQFGACNALTMETSGAPTLSIVGNSYLLSTSNAKSDGFIIRSTNPLPDTYKISVDMGDIEFDLTNPNVDLENGLYLPTITSVAGSPNINDWWHKNRKVHIDIDNNTWGWGGAHPVFIGYYNPSSLTAPDPASGQLVFNKATNSWVAINSNWASAFNYQKNTWYTFEIEKTSSTYFFRIYDANTRALLKQASIPLANVRSGQDFLAIGDPHINYYKGNVKIKNLRITNISCSAPPVITSFTANPSTINKGGSTTLSWTTTGASSWSISGIGAVTGGSKTVTPTATTTYVLTAANGSSSVTSRATVTVNPPAPVKIYLEAENASSVVLPLRIAADGTAYNGKYIYSPDVTGGAVTPGAAIATYSVNISQGGDYYLWGRVIAPDWDSDTFFVQVDNGLNHIWDLTLSSAWYWSKVNSRDTTGANSVKLSLTPGTHTLRVKVREDGAKLDLLFLTNDINTNP